MASLSGYLNFQYNISKKLERRTTLAPQLSDLATRSASQSTYTPNSEEMRVVFNKIDRDKDGRISSDDIEWLLEQTKPTTVIDGPFLTFRDFMDIHKRGVRASDIQRAFRVFDMDGDGRIGDRDLMEMMRRMGEEEFGMEECKRIVRKVDRNGIGFVDLEDFMTMMTSNMNLMLE